MMTSYRLFDAIDPFGRTWRCEFRWQQTAISIRHADAVDVKWHLAGPDQTLDKVTSLPLPLLMTASSNFDRPITDPWCMKLAALHLKMMIETWQDMDKNLVTLTAQELGEAAAAVKTVEMDRRQEALQD